MVESFFITLGFNYTWSKAIPYLLFVFLGMFLGYILLKKSKKIIYKIGAFLIIPVPFIMYFAYSPIYEGDFVDNKKQLDLPQGFEEFNEKKLIVVVLPGCGYCFASIEEMKELKRKHRIDIEYLIVSQDNSSISKYQKIIGEYFPIHLSKDLEKISDLVEGRYPSYILVDNNQLIIWNNNNFGVRAKDKIVRQLTE